MGSKTKTPDLSVRAAFSLMQGALIAMAFPLLFLMAPEFVQTLPLVVLLCFLPILSFATSSFTNWFLQSTYCGAVSPAGILTAGAVAPGVVALFGALAHWLSFLRKPVTDLFEPLPPGADASAVFSREMYGYAFWLFWAGVYSQTIASGMVATCP